MITKERIQNAIESQWRLRQSLTYLIVTAGAISVCLLRIMLDHSYQFAGIQETLILACTIMLPFIVYPVYPL